jgi:hypothetical protein
MMDTINPNKLQTVVETHLFCEITGSLCCLPVFNEGLYLSRYIHQSQPAIGVVWIQNAKE